MHVVIYYDGCQACCAKSARLKTLTNLQGLSMQCDTVHVAWAPDSDSFSFSVTKVLNHVLKLVLKSYIMCVIKFEDSVDFRNEQNASGIFHKLHVVRGIHEDNGDQENCSRGKKGVDDP